MIMITRSSERIFNPMRYIGFEGWLINDQVSRIHWVLISHLALYIFWFSKRIWWCIFVVGIFNEACYKRLKLKPVPGTLRIWELAGPQASYSPSTPLITTSSLPSQPYLTDPPLHLTLSNRTFITKYYCRFYLNCPFLFS